MKEDERTPLCKQAENTACKSDVAFRMDVRSDSEFGAWISLLTSACASFVKGALLLLAFALYPVYVILCRPIPSCFKEVVWERLFSCGYACYKKCWHQTCCDCECADFESAGSCFSVLDMHQADSDDKVYDHSYTFADAHTRVVEPSVLSSCTVWPIPLTHFSDNYGYIIVDHATGEAATVDPASPDQVLEMAAQLGVRLTTILCTHGHHDHAGGNEELRKKIAGIAIIGAASDSVPGVTKNVQEGHTVTLGEGTTFGVLHTPGHTEGHLVFTVSIPCMLLKMPIS